MKVSREQLERIRRLDPSFEQMSSVQLRRLLAAVVLELSQNSSFLHTTAVFSILFAPRKKTVEKRVRACREIIEVAKHIEEYDPLQKWMVRQILLMPMDENRSKVSWKDVVETASDKGRYSKRQIVRYRGFFFDLRRSGFLRTANSFWSLGVARLSIPRIGTEREAEMEDAENTIAAVT